MGDKLVKVHKMTVNEIKPDCYKIFTENYFEFITKFVKYKDGKLKLKVVDNFDGKDIIHQRMDPKLVFV